MGALRGPCRARGSPRFERYRPVLLYPEISPVIENPDELHEFLKGALELTVLEDLLREVDRVRKSGREAAQAVKTAYDQAVAGVRNLGGDELLTHMTRVGSTPPAGESAALRLIAAGLPSSAPAHVELCEIWSVDGSAARRATEAIGRLQAARLGVVRGARAAQSALDGLLGEQGEYLSDLRDRDMCPVCQTRGAGWVATATAQAERLRDLLAEVCATETVLEEEIVRHRTCLPPTLSARTRQALLELASPDTSERIAQWDRLAAAGGALSADTATTIGVETMLAEAADLATWYGTAKATILRGRDDTVATRVGIRNHVETWLDALDGARVASARGAVADRLGKVVQDWIKHTRTEIFEPIAKEIIALWSALTSDADLEMTGIALGGGVRQARKVNIELAVQGTPVPADVNRPAVLSTGQRNALSLATYLPRATQPRSPFRFLVLDDPIHVFDDWRVRYLAGHLAALADRYQIIVLTHDDRLWRELRALGCRPTHLRLDRPAGGKSYVRVKDITRPSDQLLDEVQAVLDREANEPLGTAEAQTAMTLAVCRQAVDTEVATQLDVLGRRLGMTDDEIRSGLGAVHTTREQLDLLNQCATRAGLNPVDHVPFNPLITALNAGAHGRAPAAATLAECRSWVGQARQLAHCVHALTG